MPESAADKRKKRTKRIKDNARKARHSGATPEWFSPPEIVEAARVLMGGIDVDPASCAQANEIVRAKRYFDKKTDGLQQRWPGRVFLNPPGGLVREFWGRLIEQIREDCTAQAIWIGFNLEQLQTLQLAFPQGPTPLDFPICIPRRRVRFLIPSRRDPPRLSTRPSHANYIAYLRSPRLARADTVYAHGRFGEVFEGVGKVRL